MAELRAAVVYDCLFPVNTGGGERVYRRLAELLVGRGIETEYITRVQWGPGQAPSASFEIATIGDHDIYDAEGRRTLAGALAFAFGTFRYLRRRRRDYDIVVASALPALTVMAAWLALVGSRTYLVADWLEVWTWAKWRSYAGVLSGSAAFVLQCVGLRLGQLQTVNSRFTADSIRRYRHRADPLVLGLVDLVGEPGAGVGVAEPPYILFVGRHIADKRITVLPAALAVARRSIPALRLVVAGSGPETPVLLDEIGRARLDGACDVVGWVDENRLRELMSGAVALVNPSSREGFGLVIAEAARVGTPSVVVDGEGNAATELIEENVNGTVAGSVSPEDLGAAIARVVEAGPGLRRSTLEWFAVRRVSGGLAESVDAILERYARARPKA